MARQNRIEFPGAFYHVLARGNNRQVIFKDDQDYKIYILRLKRYHQRYKFTLYAYTLMPNHIHLLLKTDVTPLSKVMQGIQQSYTSYFHNKYKSVGHVFQARYKAILCEKDSYLLELVRYIHLNPVRAALVSDIEDYLWSSHRVYLGYLNQSFVAKGFIFEMLFQDKFIAERKYRQFIQQGIEKGHGDLFDNVNDQLYLEGSEFVRRMKERIENQDQSGIQNGEQDFIRLQDQNVLVSGEKNLYEILKIVSEITGISLECILGRSREQKISDARSLCAYIATRHAGISNKSVAEFLGRDISSISNMIRRIEEGVTKDKAQFNHLEKVIQVMKA
ncbi:MAG: transposase [Candidatus Aminicenantaceae bacterium]